MARFEDSWWFKKVIENKIASKHEIEDALADVHAVRAFMHLGCHGCEYRNRCAAHPILRNFLFHDVHRMDMRELRKVEGYIDDV